MVYTEINNIPLPSLGANEIVKPDLFAEGINTIDKTKVQYSTAEYVYDSETETASIELDGTVLNFKNIIQILDNKAYYFRILKSSSFLDVVKRIDYNGTTSPVTNGVLIFGVIASDDGVSAKSKVLKLTSNNGEDINNIEYAENDILITNSKVTSLSAASTHDQYASAKATYDFITSSVNANAAFYITKNAAGDPFATKAELDAATTFYSGGVVRVPTRNDYCIVIDDEDNDNYSCRYLYQNDQWEFQYSYEKQFTAEQMAAINSGITAEKVAEYDEIIESGVNPKTMVYHDETTETDACIKQEGTDITDKIIDLLKDEDSDKMIIGVYGTNYGEEADTYTGTKYLWVGDVDPGEEIRALYKNTLFFVREE